MATATQSRMPDLDRDRLRADADTAVGDTLAPVTDPVERMRLAGRVADEAQAEFNRLRTKRDRLGLSLAFYDHRRAVSRRVGMTRTRWYEIRCDALRLTDAEREGGWLRRATPDEVTARAREAGVKHFPTADRRLDAVAGAAASAFERAEAARAIRDDIAVALLDEGWSREQVASEIGRNPSRMSHLKKRRDDAREVPA